MAGAHTEELWRISQLGHSTTIDHSTTVDHAPALLAFALLCLFIILVEDLVEGVPRSLPEKYEWVHPRTTEDGSHTEDFHHRGGF